MKPVSWVSVVKLPRFVKLNRDDPRSDQKKSNAKKDNAKKSNPKKKYQKKRHQKRDQKNDQKNDAKKRDQKRVLKFVALPAKLEILYGFSPLPESVRVLEYLGNRTLDPRCEIKGIPNSWKLVWAHEAVAPNLDSIYLFAVGKRPSYIYLLKHQILAYILPLERFCKAGEDNCGFCKAPISSSEWLTAAYILDEFYCKSCKANQPCEACPQRCVYAVKVDRAPTEIKTPPRTKVKSAPTEQSPTPTEQSPTPTERSATPTEQSPTTERSATPTDFKTGRLYPRQNKFFIYRYPFEAPSIHFHPDTLYKEQSLIRQGLLAPHEACKRVIPYPLCPACEFQCAFIWTTRRLWINPLSWKGNEMALLGKETYTFE